MGIAHVDSDKIAFYGTLMRGLGGMEAVGVGAALHFLGPCTLRGQLYDLGPYPGLRDDPGRESCGHVVGELFALLDPSALIALDAFEGFDPDRPAESLYTRRWVELKHPAQTHAWTYFYNPEPPDQDRIPSGDWRRVDRSRQRRANLPSRSIANQEE